MRHLPLVLALATLAACGSGPTHVVDTTGGDTSHTKPPAVDPYATFLIENTTTAAAGKLHTSYTLYLVFQPDTAFPSRTAYEGAVGPGERACTYLNGFTGDRLLAVVGVADTLTTLSPDSLTLGALETSSWPGLVRRATAVFDPLVSVDTSRGHTRARPVKWRWTISDTGTALVEDSLTVCEFP